MSESENIEKKPAGTNPQQITNKGFRQFLDYLKENKSSRVSLWIGKTSEMYSELKKADPELKEEISGGIVAPDIIVRDGALKKAVEIARIEWAKAKLESDDPIALSEAYNTRMARLNDEYHHKNILFDNVSIVGYMKDKDSGNDRLLVTKKDVGAANKIFAVDPETGHVTEVFNSSTGNWLLAVKQST